MRFLAVFDLIVVSLGLWSFEALIGGDG